MTIVAEPQGAEPLAIDVQGLTYAFPGGRGDDALTDATLQLGRGSRCLLIGANGGTSPHAYDGRRCWLMW